LKGTCSHSPRNQRGQFIQEKWLQGADLGFQPVHPIPGWTTKVPGIAGLPNWTDAQSRHSLMTGEMPDGSQANPPMPRFRMNQADAEAVVAYLRSLQPAPAPLGHTKPQKSAGE